MAAPEFQIRLHRDGLSTPWGFRLQGGSDFKTPLTIQRVFVGSPAEGELHRGDIIVAIESQPAGGMTHKVAQDLITSAGGSMALTVRRFPGSSISPVGCRPSPNARTAPAPQRRQRPVVQRSDPGMDFGTSYSGQHRPGATRGQSHVTQIHHIPVQHSYPSQVQPSYPGYTQDQVVYQPGPGYGTQVEEEPYEQRSVGDLKKKFSGGQERHPGVHRSGRRWHKPDEIGSTGMTTFGWAPKKDAPAKPASRSYVPLRAPGSGPTPLPVNREPEQNSYTPSQPSPQPVYQPSYQSQPAQQESSRPAWLGSLKSQSRGPVPKPWENDPVVAEQQANAPVKVHQPKVQTVHYAPGQSPQYRPDAPQPEYSPTARVVHLQYNTPLGLYTTGNVQEALEGQVRGRPGEGTMAVTGPAKEFDPNKSAVLKMLNQQNQPTPKRRIYQEEPTPALDLQAPQSPQQPYAYGTSDF